MDNNLEKRYSDFIEELKIEFGDFLRLAEMGRVVRNSALHARKKSLFMRSLFKKFRQMSIENDKKLETLFKEAKKKGFDETEQA